MKVYLIGAGPGDPELLTLKGKSVIEKADVVVYDYLAAPQLLAFAKPAVEKIYVGKKGNDHTISQEEINRLLVRLAKEGKIVARLKGGDPFVFGRGGEEIEELIAANIPFEIIPGVTSPIAAAAYAGIPLTHRSFTATVAFATGHEDPTKTESNVDFKALSKIGTVVFLMGVKNLPHIVKNLLAAGKNAETPVALIRRGTTAHQQTVIGTLKTIVKEVEKAKLTAPAITVVGDVVSLRDTMKWFEGRPLFGKTIAVTRSRAQASDMVERLSGLGAAVVECPTIEIQPPADNYTTLDMEIKNISTYQWLVFTSVNGVDAFFSRLFQANLDARSLYNIKTAVIGPETAKRLLTYGVKTDLMPKSYRAESVVEVFQTENVAGKKILLPRAAQARPILPVELTKMGATVIEVPAYETVTVPDSQEKLLNALKNKEIDIITFTSSSTVINLLQMIPKDQIKFLLASVTLASIGPITTQTAKDNGLNVSITANTFTIDGLVHAIQNHYKK